MVIVAAVSVSLVLVYALLLAFSATNWFGIVNQIAPVILATTCLWCSYQSVKSSKLALWTPIPWFLVACAAYFGIGPLVFHFGTPESVAFIDAFYPVDEASLLMTNLLNVVGIVLILTGCFVGLSLSRKQKPQRIREFNYVETRRLMIFFLSIGLTVQYAFAIPYRLGLISWVLPGSIQNLASFSRIAIILLIVLVQRGYGQYRWLLYLVVGEEAILALSTFSK